MPVRKDWRYYLSRIGCGGWIIISLSVLLLLNLVAGPGPDEAQRPVQEQTVDIEAALEDFGDGTLKWRQVQAENPALAQMIRNSWADALRDGHKRGQFVADLKPLLDDWYLDGIRTADYPALAAHRRAVRATGIALRSRDPQACDNYFAGRPFDRKLIPLEEQLQEAAAQSQTLLAIKTPPQPQARTRDGFMVPGRVIADAAKRAYLPIERFRAAMKSETGGTAADRCSARIGLIEAVLALPEKEALDLLRQM